MEKEKTMKKKVSLFILVMILAFTLMACDDGSAESVGGDTESVKEDKTSKEEAAEETLEIPVTKGEAVADVGDFTVTVPKGWLGAGDPDIDDDGKEIVSTNYYHVIKGGKEAADQTKKPTVDVYYTSSKDAKTLYDDNLETAEAPEEIDITVGGKKCLAFHNVMDYSAEGEDPFVMEYDNVFIPASDGSCFRITLLTSTSEQGETGIRASDKDIIAIMESLKEK